MKKLEITKGEWKISKTGAFIECRNTPIAAVSMSNTEQYANCKLIAAAPNLLHALKSIVDRLPIGLKKGFLSEEYDTAVQAIKKATE